MKLREDNVFTLVCQSFGSQGEGGLPDKEPSWTETSLERDSLDRDRLNKEPLDRDPSDRDTLDRGTLLDRNPPGQSLPTQTEILLDRDPPSRAINSRQCASSWNVFLFYMCLSIYKRDQTGSDTMPSPRTTKVSCTHPSGMLSCLSDLSKRKC